MKLLLLQLFKDRSWIICLISEWNHDFNLHLLILVEMKMFGHFPIYERIRLNRSKINITSFSF